MIVARKEDEEPDNIHNSFPDAYVI